MAFYHSGTRREKWLRRFSRRAKKSPHHFVDVDKMVGIIVSRKMSKNHSLTENTDIRACPDKRFCFFSAIKRSRKTRNERQKAHLFHTRKIFQPKNQRLRLKDFAGCFKFTLSSTTPPCAALAIASPSLSGICRTNRPICDFEGLRANGTPFISG